MKPHPVLTRERSPEVLVELRGVSKMYEKARGTSIAVLRDIDLAVRSGEFVAILGPSGSGKSTLLRIVAGLSRPSEGEVRFRNQAVEGINPGVAMVFQTFALYPWLTVLQNVELGLEHRQLPRGERRERALRVLDMVGLDGFEHAYPKELSGGMRQRVGLARALVMEPDVLLMDEPFSALDVLTAENLRRDLLELWVERKIPTRAILLVTHNIEEAVYMADRAVILSRDPGQVVADVPITIPHWRDPASPAFTRLVDEIYGIVTRRRRLEAADAAAGAASGLIPNVRAGALTGLVELLEEKEAPRVDLYALGDELQLDIEDLLPHVEAAELLGLARIHEGDIELTETGRRFANASVLERKELFRSLALARVRSLDQIVSVLRSKANRRMPREFFLSFLERRLSPGEADRQLDTLIDWGRYGELFAYDDEARVLYLEPEEPA
ncbi:ABC transporter ATP-binding protein [Caldinitratiruptor microaerophilus]|uniref:Nitrate ABC transporter ATP-binding protein n=1 Tax=Caldinitratiruptor microaerophilus TaxID=671077 RepID=A0AA35CJE2_9FIRM|nr:nitrate/sulfonate/bicarbonate ABC transporter ATP-binding protein [Caldinitratiruptor microaerophilus]BDG60302.1 nitrate ABC transporter ATP-binding protein [Caldinitratiruptor microaerophilus]